MRDAIRSLKNVDWDKNVKLEESSGHIWRPPSLVADWETRMAVSSLEPPVNKMMLLEKKETCKAAKSPCVSANPTPLPIPPESRLPMKSERKYKIKNDKNESWIANDVLPNRVIKPHKERTIDFDPPRCNRSPNLNYEPKSSYNPGQFAPSNYIPSSIPKTELPPNNKFSPYPPSNYNQPPVSNLELPSSLHPAPYPPPTWPQQPPEWYRRNDPPAWSSRRGAKRGRPSDSSRRGRKLATANTQSTVNIELARVLEFLQKTYNH